MISQIWTLAAASGGPEKTLAAWGFTGAALTRSNQAADVLTLTATPADALVAAEMWPWETEVILRRAGEVYYRGYLADNPLTLSPTGETVTHEFRSLWWLLDRLDYRQDWPAMVPGGGLGTVSTGRVRLGDGPEGATAHAMIAELAAFAASMDVPLRISTALLPSTPLPKIEAHNRTVAELLRDILRWVPDVTATAVYDETGTSFMVVAAASATLTEIPIGESALSSLTLRPLYERQVDKVRITYEASAPQEVDAGEGGFRRAAVLVAAVDEWPTSAPTTRRTLSVTLPHPTPPDASGANSAPTSQTTSQPVAAETWPSDGATDAAAEKWWLERSGLAVLGITSDAVLLPTTTTKSEFAHRVILDPAEPIPPPSAINPESTPLWRPPAATDTPRELVAGSISDWMSVKCAKLLARVTIAVRKSAVSGLSEENKAGFLRLGPRERKLQGIDAYLIDATYSFLATDAKTKVYSKILSVDYGGGDGGAAEDYEAAAAAAKVPGLARRLYEALSPLHHAGGITLSVEEAPLRSAMGSCVRLSHPSRPDWASMRAVVQSESVDLSTGSIRLSVGPPEHLSPQDWVALHASARSTQERRTVAAQSPASPTPSGGGGGETAAKIKGNPVVGGTYTPLPSFLWSSGGSANLSRWDLVPGSSSGTYILRDPLLVAGLTALGTAINIDNNPITPAAGKWVVLRLKNPPATSGAPSYELALADADESGGIEVYGFDGNDALTKEHLPLWKLVATETPVSVALAAGVYGVRYVGGEVLALVRHRVVIPDRPASAFVRRLYPL